MFDPLPSVQRCDSFSPIMCGQMATEYFVRQTLQDDRGNNDSGKNGTGQVLDSDSESTPPWHIKCCKKFQGPVSNVHINRVMCGLP